MPVKPAYGAVLKRGRVKHAVKLAPLPPNLYSLEEKRSSAKKAKTLERHKSPQSKDMALTGCTTCPPPGSRLGVMNPVHLLGDLANGGWWSASSGGSMVGSDRLNVPAIDNSSH